MNFSKKFSKVKIPENSSENIKNSTTFKEFKKSTLENLSLNRAEANNFQLNYQEQ